MKGDDNMQSMIRRVVLGGLFATVSLFATGAAKAQGFGYGGYPAYGPAPGYGVPGTVYYGNGGHDYQPHWHTRQTPFGSYSYYGQGGHDFRPHAHVQTPYGVTSYSNGRFSSTQSYSPPAPYVFRPW
jgi:hypothetical protein